MDYNVLQKNNIEGTRSIKAQGVKGRISYVQTSGSDYSY